MVCFPILTSLCRGRKSLHNLSKTEMGYKWAEVIRALPEADLQIAGIRGWILQGENQQLMFFEFETNAKVPEHSHAYPQWGTVIHGQMKLVVDDETRLCKRGDEYVIPAQARHSATFPVKARVIDFFQEKQRYKTKLAK